MSPAFAPGRRELPAGNLDKAFSELAGRVKVGVPALDQESFGVAERFSAFSFSKGGERAAGPAVFERLLDVPQFPAYRSEQYAPATVRDIKQRAVLALGLAENLFCATAELDARGCPAVAGVVFYGSAWIKAEPGDFDCRVILRPDPSEQPVDYMHPVMSQLQQNVDEAIKAADALPKRLDLGGRDVELQYFLDSELDDPWGPQLSVAANGPHWVVIKGDQKNGIYCPNFVYLHMPPELRRV